MITLALFLVLGCMTFILSTNLFIGARDSAQRLFRAAEQVRRGERTAEEAARETGLTGRNLPTASQVQDEAKRVEDLINRQRQGQTFRGGKPASNTEIKFFDLEGNPVSGRRQERVTVPKGALANPGANTRGGTRLTFGQTVQTTLLQRSGFTISKQGGVTVAQKGGRNIFIQQGRILADLPSTAKFDLSKTISRQRTRKARQVKQKEEELTLLATAKKKLKDVEKIKAKARKGVKLTKFERLVLSVGAEEARLQKRREERIQKTKVIPGLRGDSFIQKALREALQVPRDITFGFGEAVGLQLAQASILVSALFTAEQRKKIIPIVSKAFRQTPGSLKESFDVTTPAGLVNTVVTLLFIKAGAGKKKPNVVAANLPNKGSFVFRRPKISTENINQGGSFTTNKGQRFTFFVDTKLPKTGSVGKTKIIIKDSSGTVVIRKIGNTVVRTKLKPSVAKKITSITNVITSQKKSINARLRTLNSQIRGTGIRIRLTGVRTRLLVKTGLEVSRLKLLSKLDPFFDSIKKSGGKITSPVKKQLTKINNAFEKIQQKLEINDAKSIRTQFFKPKIRVDVSVGLKSKIRILEEKIKKTFKEIDKVTSPDELNIRLIPPKVKERFKLFNERSVLRINRNLEVVSSIVRDLKTLKNIVKAKRTRKSIARRQALVIKLKQKINPLRSELNKVGFKIQSIKKKVVALGKKVLLNLREAERLQKDVGGELVLPRRVIQFGNDFKFRFSNRLRAIRADLIRSKKVMTSPIRKKIRRLNNQLKSIGAEIKFRVDRKTGKLLSKAGKIISKISPVEVTVKRIIAQKRLGKVSLKRFRKTERKRLLVRAENNQLLKDIRAGIAPLRASTSSRIRKQLRKDIIGKRSLTPLKIPPSAFDRKVVVGKLNQKELKQLSNIRARDQLVKEILSNPGSLNTLSVRSSIRKILRKKIISKRAIDSQRLKIPKGTLEAEPLTKQFKIITLIEKDIKKKVNPFSPAERLKQIAELNRVDRKIQRFSEVKDKGGKSSVLLLKTKTVQLSKVKTVAKVKGKEIVLQKNKLKTLSKSKLVPRIRLKIVPLLNTLVKAEQHQKQIIIILTRQVTKLTSLVRQKVRVGIKARVKVSEVIRGKPKQKVLSKFAAQSIQRKKLFQRQRTIKRIVILLEKDIKRKVRRNKRKGRVDRKFSFSPDIVALLSGIKATPKERKLLLKRGRIFTGLERRRLV